MHNIHANYETHHGLDKTINQMDNPEQRSLTGVAMMAMSSGGGGDNQLESTLTSVSSDCDNEQEEQLNGGTNPHHILNYTNENSCSESQFPGSNCQRQDRAATPSNGESTENSDIDDRDNESIGSHTQEAQNKSIVRSSSNGGDNRAIVCHQQQDVAHVAGVELVVSASSNMQKTQQQQSTRSTSNKINPKQHAQQQQQHNEFDGVKQVELFGVRIVALTINGRERLCLAQISNTLLKEFSYNEIHNRRVALGITCVQCTPIQLEMLRRAGAMPSSSRRCGMITMREAERLCRSFLVEEQPPELPENFYFTVAHKVNFGCKGRFVPERYISSRAKCIECFYCGEFYSPNKFIFHSHRQPNATDCNPPDSPNINSWRKHIDLDWTHEHSQEIKYAWEDVKSLFNGGTRRRVPMNGNSSGGGGTSLVIGTGRSVSPSIARQISSNDHQQHSQTTHDSPLSGGKESLIKNEHQDLSTPPPSLRDEEHALIDVEFHHETKKKSKPHHENTMNGMGAGRRKLSQTSWRQQAHLLSAKQYDCDTNSAASVQQQQQQHQQQKVASHSTGSLIRGQPLYDSSKQLHSLKRLPHETASHFHQQLSKRFAQVPGSSHKFSEQAPLRLDRNSIMMMGSPFIQTQPPCTTGTSPLAQADSNLSASPAVNVSTQQALFVSDLINQRSQQAIPIRRQLLASNDNSSHHQQQQQHQQQPQHQQQMQHEHNKRSTSPTNYMRPPSASTNFIYSQLYSQLMQQLPHQQQSHQAPLQSSIDAQLALRHHLWSNLLASLQCNAAAAVNATPGPGSVAPTPPANRLAHQQAYNSHLAGLHQQQQQSNLTHSLQCNSPMSLAAATATNNGNDPSAGALQNISPVQDFNLNMLQSQIYSQCLPQASAFNSK